MKDWCDFKTSKNCYYIALIFSIIVIIVGGILLYVYVFKDDGSTKSAGKPRRSMISIDSRGYEEPIKIESHKYEENLEPQPHPEMVSFEPFEYPELSRSTPQARGGRVRPYPCLFMPGGATQQTSPICNENIPWFPPYNRGTWPERFPGRFSSDYAPEYVAPLNERFYQSDLHAQDIDEQMQQKKAKNSLLNSFARAPIAGSNRMPETASAGNEGFTKTNLNITFPSIPGQYNLRSQYSNPPGTVPQAQMARQSLASANVARTQTLKSSMPSTPAHIESRLAGNADLMSKKKASVPKELAHLSDQELNALVQDELESQECFKCDKPLDLPISIDGYDPTRDITTDNHYGYTNQGKGLLSRFGNKGVQDKINNLYRHGPHAVVPSEEEMEYNIHAYNRPTKKNQDYWMQYATDETRPAIDSVLQDYNYMAYTNVDDTFQSVDGQTVNTSFGP